MKCFFFNVPFANFYVKTIDGMTTIIWDESIKCEKSINIKWAHSFHIVLAWMVTIWLECIVCVVCLALFPWANTIFHHFRRFSPQVHPPHAHFICSPFIFHAFFFFILYCTHEHYIIHAIDAYCAQFMQKNECDEGKMKRTHFHWIIQFEFYYICFEHSNDWFFFSSMCMLQMLFNEMANKLWTTIFYCLHFQKE